MSLNGSGTGAEGVVDEREVGEGEGRGEDNNGNGLYIYHLASDASVGLETTLVLTQVSRCSKFMLQLVRVVYSTIRS